MSQTSRLHLPSLIQFVISGVGILVSLPVVLIFCVIGFLTLASGEISSPATHMLFSVVWIAGLVSLLLLPSLILSFRRLVKKHETDSQKIDAQSESPLPHPRNLDLRFTICLVFFFSLVLVAGEFLSRQANLASLFMPPLTILAIGIPLWLVLQLGWHKLYLGSPQRQWGLLSVSLVITPWIILLAEIILIIILGSILITWFTSQPNLVEEINRLTQRLTDAQMDPEIVVQIVRPYFQQPIVIISLLVVSAGLIPMLEEFLKPLGMWVLAFNKLTPQEGFTAGLICGSAFAMFESLGMMASYSGEGWATLVIGRMGTGILHSLSTALTGWGLAVAWSEKKYLGLGAIYLVSVFLHGLWNTFSLLLAFEPFLGTSSINNSPLTTLPSISPLILLTLTIFLIIMLAGSNRLLRRSQVAPLSDDKIIYK